MRTKSLASGLDNLYADRIRFVEKFTIMVYSGGSESEIQVLLNEWASKGYI